MSSATHHDTPLDATARLFFRELDGGEAARITADALSGAEDGELFLEYRESEMLSLEDGRIRSATFDTQRGFGLRAVRGAAAAYAHAGEVNDPALKRAAAAVRGLPGEGTVRVAEPPRATNARLYDAANPLHAMDFPAKSALLAEIDAFARARDPRVVQVMASLYGEWQAVRILRGDGREVADLRPLVRLNVSVVVEADGRRETRQSRHGRPLRLRPRPRRGLLEGGRGRGAAPGRAEPRQRAGAGRGDGGRARPGLAGHPAARGDRPRAGGRLQPQGHLRLRGADGPARRSKGVTVVDDGTIPDRRGSLTVDDEGTPSGRTVMIEDGILTGFIQDRQNARLMGVAPTGNGRRQSHAHVPMPRMTNTVMLGGDYAPEEIIRERQERPLRRELRRRAGGHHLRQVRLLRLRGLHDRGRARSPPR